MTYRKEGSSGEKRPIRQTAKEMVKFIRMRSGRKQLKTGSYGGDGGGEDNKIVF